MLQVTAILLITSLTSVGLLATWAATSPWHWFWRTGIFIAALSLLLLIPAYEPFVAFVLQGAVISAGIQTSHWWRKRKAGGADLKPTTRFSLATILLVTVYVAIATAIFVRIPKLNLQAWQSIVLIGFNAGLITLMSLWSIYGITFRWWIRIALVFPVIGSLSILLCASDWFIISMISLYTWPPDADGLSSYFGKPAWFTEDHHFFVWFVVNFSVTIILSCISWILCGFTSNANDNLSRLPRFNKLWKQTIAYMALLVLSCVILMPPARIYYQLMTPLPIPKTTVPSPNGWDDLLAAGKIVQNSKEVNILTNYDTATKVQLATAVTAMSSVYSQVQLGLTHEIVCPIDFEDSQGWLFDSLQPLRNLARSLASRGLVKQHLKKIDDAADSFLWCIQFGYEIRRGGLKVNNIVGNACSGVGFRLIYNIHQEISAHHCQNIIITLVRLEQTAEAIEEVIHRDRIWSQHANGWSGHFIQILEDLDKNDSSDLNSSIIYLDKVEIATMRLLQCELAIQAWQVTEGKLPDSLDGLVPQYLPEIPLDPFSPQDSLLQYRLNDERYVLYSVGSNGIDDNGTPPEEDDRTASNSGDLRLDVRFAPDPQTTVDTDLSEGEAGYTEEDFERTDE